MFTLLRFFFSKKIQIKTILVYKQRTLIHYATIHATVCSNRWKEPIQCLVKWMRDSDWSSPSVAANSRIVYCGFKSQEVHLTMCVSVDAFVHRLFQNDWKQTTIYWNLYVLFHFIETFILFYWTLLYSIETSTLIKLYWDLYSQSTLIQFYWDHDGTFWVFKFNNYFNCNASILRPLQHFKK